MLYLQIFADEKIRENVRRLKMNGSKLNDFLLNKAKNIPFGIISGSLGIVAFFSTIGLIVAYAINAGIAAQTNRAITIFSTWYQTLLFFAVLISVIGGIFALVMYVLKRRALIAAHDPKYFDFVDDGKESETDLDKAHTGVNA